MKKEFIEYLYRYLIQAEKEHYDATSGKYLKVMPENEKEKRAMEIKSAEELTRIHSTKNLFRQVIDKYFETHNP